MKEKWQRALMVGICGNILAVAAAALVFREPPGSAIRPMDIPLYMLSIAILTALVGVPLAWVSANKDRLIAMPLVAAVLCSSPLVSGFVAFYYFVNAFQYTLKP